MIDELANVIASPLRSEPVEAPAVYKAFFEENCRKCGGSGRFRSASSGRDCGPCFACKGKGSQTFSRPFSERLKTRDAAASRKARKAADGLKNFADAYPSEWAWMDGNNFGFAVAMREAIAKYGYLTDGQLAAVRKCIIKREAAIAAAEARKADAPVVAAASVDALTAAFDNAVKTGKRAKLIFDGFMIYPAKPTSQNAGALYVRSDEGVYLGKITGGRFQPRRECSDAQVAAVLAVAADPHGAAVAYGRQTRSCSVCGIELTNPESVEAGIGPICAKKMGW